MLTRILTAIGEAGRPLCLADLERELGVDGRALEGMVDTLVAKGRLRVVRFDDARCGGCRIRSGCFLMADGVAATYALVQEAPPGASPTPPGLRTARVA